MAVWLLLAAVASFLAAVSLCWLLFSRYAVLVVARPAFYLLSGALVFSVLCLLLLLTPFIENTHLITPPAPKIAHISTATPTQTTGALQRSSFPTPFSFLNTPVSVQGRISNTPRQSASTPTPIPAFSRPTPVPFSPQPTATPSVVPLLPQPTTTPQPLIDIPIPLTNLRIIVNNPLT